MNELCKDFLVFLNSHSLYFIYMYQKFPLVKTINTYIAELIYWKVDHFSAEISTVILHLAPTLDTLKRYRFSVSISIFCVDIYSLYPVTTLKVWQS